MSLPITASGSPAFLREVEEVLATLPRTLAPRTSDHHAGGEAGVVIVDGASAWAGEVRHALGADAAGVLVVEPHPADIDDLRRLREQTASSGVPLRLARRWADDPALGALAARPGPRPGGRVMLIDSDALVAPGSDEDHLLITQLDLVRAFTGGTPRLHTLTRHGGGYVAAGTVVHGDDHRPLLLSGALSSALPPRARVRELRSSGRCSAEVGDGRVARAAQVRIGDATGEVVLPAINETACRAQLRALAGDISSGSSGSGELDGYLTAVSAAGVRKGRNR